MDFVVIFLHILHGVSLMMPPIPVTHTPILAFKSKPAGAFPGTASSPRMDALAGPGLIADNQHEDRYREERMSKPTKRGRHDVKYEPMAERRATTLPFLLHNSVQ